MVSEEFTKLAQVSGELKFFSPLLNFCNIAKKLLYKYWTE